MAQNFIYKTDKMMEKSFWKIILYKKEILVNSSANNINQ